MGVRKASARPPEADLGSAAPPTTHTQAEEAGQEVYIDGGFEPFMCRGRPGGIYRRRLRAVYTPRAARRYISTEASSRLRAKVGQEVYIDGGFELFMRRGRPGGIYRRTL